MSNRFRWIWLTQSEKGGPGKTTVADAVVAALHAGGEKVLVVDADDGNSGYIRRCGDQSAVPLGWTTGADALEAWTDRLAGDHHVLIDCGANLIASGAPVNVFLGELIVQTRDAGGHVVALAIASPNAPGCDRLVREMRDSYGGYADVRLIKNNVDGSNAFATSLTTLGMSQATFPHLAPGLVAARLGAQAPLLSVLTDPPPGYGLAMALYAQALGKFVAEAAFSDIFPEQAASTLAGLARKAPGSLQYIVRTMAQARDVALTANNKVFEARRGLREAEQAAQSDAAIARAASALMRAEEAYAKLRV